MPDNAEELYEAAVGVGKILTNTHFSICALGDTGYDLFCQSGKDWDKTMEDMGGSSIDRLTNQTGGVDGDTLGATGGAETLTLLETQMPSHNHSGVV